MKYLEFEYPTHEKIWGEEKWIISAHANGQAIIKGTKQNLGEYYLENRGQFGDNLPEEFPLLVKVINTFDDLSIQVHPNDEYAMKHEQSLGKSECWYILDAKDTDIIAGQKKLTKAELEEAIENNKFFELCELKKIQQGDFFYIPPGCIHAIRRNTSILEIQQSSDITYRLYDYERRDDNGNLRELHLKQAVDVIDYDYQNDSKTQKIDEYTTNLVDCEYFYVDLIAKKQIKLEATNQFKMVIAVDGPMYIDDRQIAQNEGVIILRGQELEIRTENKIVVSGLKK